MSARTLKGNRKDGLFENQVVAKPQVHNCSSIAGLAVLVNKNFPGQCIHRPHVAEGDCGLMNLQIGRVNYFNSSRSQ